MKKICTYLVSLCLLIGLTVQHCNLNYRHTTHANFEISSYAPSQHAQHSENNAATYEINSIAFISSIADVYIAFIILSKNYGISTKQAISVQKDNHLVYQSSINNAVFLCKTITSKYQRIA
ncbi:hypothetical protein [Maribacter sp. 1_MG-2023]|uniref:hypothetical protein n=1 Tax=Maribacter sp. 1_MG-2023 TaxID=3062677 RepID=UPI0026E349D9|nr:hypothetical protein [Maribacter sp. 1_MG-2023]MDO6471067.1 hypothetical protein [Maribacter sp. 1_MG-2023]